MLAAAVADDELLSAILEGLADVAAGRVVEHEELWIDLDPGPGGSRRSPTSRLQ
jgi:predicted transcriptional regulator